MCLMSRILGYQIMSSGSIFYMSGNKGLGTNSGRVGFSIVVEKEKLLT